MPIQFIFDRWIVKRLSPNKLEVILGVDDCTISATSTKDIGKSYHKVYKNTKDAVFDNIFSDMIIVITKQNCIPAVYEYKFSYIIGQIQSCSADVNGNIKVETLLGQDVKDAILKVSSADGIEEQSIDVKSDDSGLATVQIISNLKKGLHNVSLYVNGHLTDSNSIILK